MSINRVIISGNLTRDPELRTTQSGMAVLQFGMAVNERVKNQQTGEWEDRPNFIDCTMFGNRAEAVSRYIFKGTKVAVEGKLRYSQWERNGQKRSKLEVVVDELEFMSRGESPSGAPSRPKPPQPSPAPQYAPQAAPQPAYAPAPQYQQPSVYDGPSSVYDEDIPF